MNYLVHLYLSGDNPYVRLGGLMGDFVKGTIPESVHPEIRTGLVLHRRIDSFAARNDHTRRSRLRIDPGFRHVRGIMIDIFYDHFLATDWSDYHSQRISEYAQDVYGLLENHKGLLPQGLAEIAPRMIEHNWLVAYSRRDVVDRALKRISERLSRPTRLAEGYGELEQHEAGLRQDFARFMEEAGTYSERFLRQEQNE